MSQCDREQRSFQPTHNTECTWLSRDQGGTTSNVENKLPKTKGNETRNWRKSTENDTIGSTLQKPLSISKGDGADGSQWGGLTERSVISTVTLLLDSVLCASLWRVEPNKYSCANSQPHGFVNVNSVCLSHFTLIQRPSWHKRETGRQQAVSFWSSFFCFQGTFDGRTLKFNTWI